MYAGMNRGQDSTASKRRTTTVSWGQLFRQDSLQLNWQSQTLTQRLVVTCLDGAHTLESDRVLQGRQGQLHLAMLPGSSGPGCQAGGRLFAPRPLPSLPGGHHRQCTHGAPVSLSAHSSTAASRCRKAFLESGVSQADQRRELAVAPAGALLHLGREQAARGPGVPGFHGPPGPRQGRSRPPSPHPGAPAPLTREIPLHPENSGPPSPRPLCPARTPPP